MPGTSKPVRGSSAVAEGAGEGVVGVVLVDPLFVWTGGWVLSGGPVVWRLGAVFRAAELVVEDFWVFFVVLPNGSVYWSSPAPLCARAGAAEAARAAVASTGRSRRQPVTGRQSRASIGGSASTVCGSVAPAMASARPLHILVLTDRDWTHPQGGGTGTNLFGQVSRWLAWGHKVTVIAGDYAGAKPVEQLAPNLVVHRMGTRMTVFPRAAWAVFRGLGRDADVVLEVVNGVAFYTPLWWFLRKPRVALVHHVHQDHYVAEMGPKGSLAAFIGERLPLRFLYRGTEVLTISDAARNDLVALGVPRERIHVAYLGVEPAQFHPGARSERPSLLYLGRLKQYKRVESTLEVLEGIPEARLDIAGDGDHRPVLEAEVERRGLEDRVTFHGFVEEDEKADLYGQAWMNLTASSAEGWCLTVMEAAACGTPSAALRVGGLSESIVDGETGVLAETPAELTAKVRGVLSDPQRRDELGESARARARGFTWENAAQSNLALLERVADRPRTSLREQVRASETAKAGGLAFATLASNAVQLIFVVIFTRLLGATDYGSLAALVSAFLILLVGGQALQVAAARETTLHRLGDGPRLSATMDRWTQELLIACLAACAIGYILRDQIGHLVGVPEHSLAAAAILPTGVLWMLLCLQRGALQGVRGFKPVGISLVLEALGRLVCGLALVAVGLGVTGAFLGTPLALAVTSIALFVVLRRRLGRPEPGAEPPHSLRWLVRGAWAPIGALALLALLQNVDVIVVKHQVGGDAAGSYAAAAVAAKAVVWVAIGVGLHLLPEATRRTAAGLDPLPVLRRALAVLALVAAPALLIFAVAPEQLLRIAFGPDLTDAASALVVLGAAMTVLACAYLTVQYMLALGRTSFLWVLGVVALIEPFLLSAGTFSLMSYASLVLALQCVAALGVLVLALRLSGRRSLATAR
jgi:glycosyltransferase involved in cell wall biosynthesis/O-antigen/teichoic acid export membrane protein